MTRPVQLNIRLSEYEDRQLQQEATKQGVSKSDLVRKLISRLPKPKEDKDA
ncbi:MAG TPA: ribbon-helix-helix protein, CopG family [Coleofasciculaceae cyanobacterium]